MSEVDQSLYFFKHKEVTILIWIHLDNGVILSNSLEAVHQFKETLCSKLDVKWKDSLSQIVGLECGFGEVEVAIAQQRLTNGILDAYPRKVIHHDSPFPPSLGACLEKNNTVINVMPYRLVSESWPDLAFAVNFLACHSMGPRERHWLLLDHLIGSLLKTHNRGVVLKPRSLLLNLWSDAGWGRPGAVSVRFYSQSWQHACVVGFQTTGSSGSINMCSGIRRPVRFNSEPGTRDESTFSAGQPFFVTIRQ
ncbi:hypothetical protein O181_010675 [Austropuccinia psidii MF-1]|uniref:Uncharacterized protein n=1 Tax=Austropuccinia psidii MF-1 TaxID=1389203 RepID=A0A9Q3BTP2_9BASI|nr:hypothetical protein [Austropuccinia psidii MF-1]